MSTVTILPAHPSTTTLGNAGSAAASAAGRVAVETAPSLASSLSSFFSSLSFTTKVIAISGTVAASYVLFYTGYDKARGQLRLQTVKDLFTGKRGWDWSISEANKVLALSGLTGVLISFTPMLHCIGLTPLTVAENRALLLVSMAQLWVHGGLSMSRFYHFSIRKVMADAPIRRVSVLMAVGAQLALAAGLSGQISRRALIVSATVLGLGHFYTYELDYQNRLRVRPFAYLPFALGGLTLLLVGYGEYVAQCARPTRAVVPLSSGSSSSPTVPAVCPVRHK